MLLIETSGSREAIAIEAALVMDTIEVSFILTTFPSIRIPLFLKSHAEDAEEKKLKSETAVCGWIRNSLFLTIRKFRCSSFRCI